MTPAVYQSILIDMATTIQCAFRLEPEIVEWLDAEAVRMAAAMPGMRIARADVVRVLVTRAMQSAPSPRAAPPPKRRRIA